MRKPDFFIVGAPKCGTSALCTYLKQHPEIFIAQLKELHFFGSDVRYPKRPTLDGYLAHFASARDERRIGEGSTSYLFSERAAREIQEFNPSAKIIIMLRNPVDTMYSLHSELLYWLNEDLEDFEAALAAEEPRKSGLMWPQRVHIIDYSHYRRNVRFAEQVRRYFDVFGRERVQVILQEEFNRDRAGIYEQTLRFLDVSADFRPDFKDVNGNKRIRNRALQRFLLEPPAPVGWIRDKLPTRIDQIVFGLLRRLNTSFTPRPRMRSELRKQLQSEFLPEVEQLSELLGRDLTYWCKGGSQTADLPPYGSSETTTDPSVVAAD
jgi:hypothetical protein